MKWTRAAGLPLTLLIGLGVAVPTAAYAVGDAGGQGQRVYVGATGSVAVQADSAMAQAYATGCGGHYSDTVVPSTIRVLRGSGKVDVVPFKTYVENVLPNEWVPSWSAASLQAGAMAVKSFGWYWTNHSAGRISPRGECYDVTDNTSSQVYRPGSATASTSAAVEQTWDSRLTRGGRILEAHYCSTSTACGAWVAGDWMSQNGTRDLADRGTGYASILRHYYRGVQVTGAGAGTTAGRDRGAGRHVTDTKYQRVWKTAPSYRTPSAAKRAGHVNSGMKHFTCQVIGAEVRAEGYHNRWWLRTDDDSGNRNVWINAVYVDPSEHTRDGRIPHVAVCPAPSKPTRAKVKPGPKPKPEHRKSGGARGTEVVAHAPSYLLPVAVHRVGVLHRGRQRFACQQQGWAESFRGHRSTWWLKTDDDSGNHNVWVSATYVAGGRDGGRVPGVPTC